MKPCIVIDRASAARHKRTTIGRPGRKLAFKPYEPNMSAFPTACKAARQLTDRQRQVFLAWAEEDTAKGAGARLGVSVRTIHETARRAAKSHRLTPRQLMIGVVMNAMEAER